MLVRVRTNTGVWRVPLVDTHSTGSGTSSERPSWTVAHVLAEIQQSRPHVVYETPLCFDPACRQPLDLHQSLMTQGIVHGTMMYCRVDPATTLDISVRASVTTTTATATAEQSQEGASSSLQHHQQHSGMLDGSQTTRTTATGNNTTMRRVIDKDGTIKLVPTGETSNAPDRGFRKGMLALRDMKMHWTLSDFMLMDSQYEFKIQRQEAAICKQVSLDIPSIADFQAYVQRFAFQRNRFGFLYGKFIPENASDSSETLNDGNETTKVPMKCRVEAIYEPPQEADSTAAEGFVVQDDDQEDTVNEIASMLGLTKVGWIFGHEPRGSDYTLSAAEVIMAAEFQLEAADGVNETPFVTVTVAPAANGTVSVEAFQVSQQCMAMVAEEALEVGSDPKVCVINETFTAIQEGKESKTVENSFFLAVVPIAKHTSDIFVAEFPRANRDLDDRTPSHDEMKKHLAKSGTAGWTFIDRLADFNLLIYLSKFLDVHADFPKICAAVVDRSVALDDGYKIIIKSMAGMDGAY